MYVTYIDIAIAIAIVIPYRCHPARSYADILSRTRQLFTFSLALFSFFISYLRRIISR